MTMSSSAQLIMGHILQVVFALPMDSPQEKTLNYNGYAAPEDFITETDDTLDNLDNPNDAGAMVRTSKGSAGSLKSFKQYVAFQAHQGTPINVSSGWSAITWIDFNKF